MNAAGGGRMIFEPNVIQYTPKTKVDQQQIPAFFMETDLAAPVTDFDAVLYLGMSSRIMDMDYTAMNKGLGDPVNRNDVTVNDGFNFMHLKLVNITDTNKPVEHDLSSSTFNNGQSVVTHEEVVQIVENLNHKGMPRKKTRTRQMSQQNFDRLNFVRSADGNSIIRKNLTQEEKAEYLKVRLIELNAPVIQGEMIRVTKAMGEKRVKVIFLSAGKQTVTRLSKDCFNWTATIHKDILDEPKSEWYKFFQGCWRLCDMIDPKFPVTIFNPEPSNDGTAFEHQIKPNYDQWSEYNRNKFKAHIEGQQINTFMGQLTVIDNSNTNPMKCYLVPVYGNYLFWSILSAMENPCTTTKEFPVIDTKYKVIGEVQPGGRLNLKAIPHPKDRLKAMVQLIKHNRGQVDTFTYGPNYANPQDPNKTEDDTPIFRTRMTLPICPVEENYYCSTLVANAENLTRASQLFHEIKSMESFSDDLIQMEQDEQLRQAQMVGVGTAAPGIWLGLYGVKGFEGSQLMELRNDLVCEAFVKKDDTKMKEQMEDFTIVPPAGK